MILLPTCTAQTRELLKYHPLQYMFNAIAANPGLAQIYANSASQAKTVMVILKRSIFIGGAFSEGCLSFLSDVILCDEVRKRLHIFYISYPDEIWHAALMKMFGASASPGVRSLYGIKTQVTACDLIDFDPNIKTMAGQDTGNYGQIPEIAVISPELMSSSVENLSMIVDEVIGTGTYNDMEDFLARGIGFALVADNRVCGFCTSEYPSPGEIAIGIEVLPGYQQKGFATAMTRAFLAEAARRGLHVYWDCWSGNVASAKTAMACGLSKIAEFGVLCVEL